MVRPVAFDLLTFLVPLAAGAGGFFAGRAFPRWPRAVRAGVVAAAVGVVAVGGLALARVLPDGPGAAFSRAGGLRVALGGAALLLLGVASATPGRSFTPGFLRALAYLAGHRYGVGREPGLEAAGLRVDDHRLGGRDRRLAPGDQHQGGGDQDGTGSHGVARSGNGYPAPNLVHAARHAGLSGAFRRGHEGDFPSRGSLGTPVAKCWKTCKALKALTYRK